MNWLIILIALIGCSIVSRIEEIEDSVKSDDDDCFDLPPDMPV